ncbi:MAG TPA: DUF302 domain-containing protein [Polyangia bacterium]|nr:DUF302 domain-containing protein [Polyangia bacterium]
MDDATNGVVDLRSARAVGETIDRVEAMARARGLKIFARIDFSGDAAAAGMALRPMQMLLFGSPKAGTPLMAAAPRVGLDLPLKALCWEDANGATWLSFNAPAYIGGRHGLTPDLVARIAGIASLLEEVVRSDSP